MSITIYEDKSGRERYRVEVMVGYTIDGVPDRRTIVCDPRARKARRASRPAHAGMIPGESYRPRYS